MKPSTDFLSYATDLDAVDRLLVEALQADGRRAFTDLARAAGITEKTARRRVGELIDRGSILITAVTDPRTLGYEASAQLGVELDGTRSASAVAEELARLQESDYVVVASGRFPIYCEVFCRDAEALRDTIDHIARAVPGVRGVESFRYLTLAFQQARLSETRRRGAVATGVRPQPLDEPDRCVVQALSANGRASFQAIAERCGMSESQARQRASRLVESGVMQVMAIINPLGLDFRTMAWLAIKAAPGTGLVELAEAFAHLPFVSYVVICTGRFDLFVEVVCVSEAELLELLDRDVRSLSGIQEIEVSPYLELHYKRLTPAG